MDMYANSLASLGGSKYSNDGHFGLKIFLRDLITKRQWRIQLRRGRLVMIDTVETHTEWLHRSGVWRPEATATLRRINGSRTAYRMCVLFGISVKNS